MITSARHDNAKYASPELQSNYFGIRGLSLIRVTLQLYYDRLMILCKQHSIHNDSAHGFGAEYLDSGMPVR